MPKSSNKSFFSFPSWLSLTDPKDVARVELRTVISTTNMLDTIPMPKSGFADAGTASGLRNLKATALGNWMSPEDLKAEVNDRFPGCMKGRTMYVIPYSMGPVGGALSKTGIEITDSPYVVCEI